jgi:hypothetical protein
MGGATKTENSQSSTTAPWQAAQPALQGILGQIGTGLNNTGLTGTETGAINQLEQNAGQAGQFAPQIADYAKTLLAGGGATDQAGNVNANYQRYVDQTNPLASNMNYDPMQNPGTADLLSRIQSDVGNSVNGQFAAAGRDFSGANQQAYGRGIAQGEAPVLFDQYNANRTAQQGAAGNLYQAGNTTAGLQTGMTQQGLINKGQGVTAATAATEAANAPANAQLQAEAARRGIPVQALGLLAQIGIPIAGLGGQSTGQSQGTQEMSGAQQFATIAGGIGSMIPKAPMTFNF